MPALLAFACALAQDFDVLVDDARLAPTGDGDLLTISGRILEFPDGAVFVMGLTREAEAIDWKTDTFTSKAGEAADVNARASAVDGRFNWEPIVRSAGRFHLRAAFEPSVQGPSIREAMGPEFIQYTFHARFFAGAPALIARRLGDDLKRTDQWAADLDKFNEELTAEFEDLESYKRRKERMTERIGQWVDAAHQQRGTALLTGAYENLVQLGIAARDLAYYPMTDEELAGGHPDGHANISRFTPTGEILTTARAAALMAKIRAYLVRELAILVFMTLQGRMELFDRLADEPLDDPAGVARWKAYLRTLTADLDAVADLHRSLGESARGEAYTEVQTVRELRVKDGKTTPGNTVASIDAAIERARAVADRASAAVAAANADAFEEPWRAYQEIMTLLEDKLRRNRQPEVRTP